MIKKGAWIRLITYIFLFVVLTGCLTTYESDSKVYIAVGVYIIAFLPVLIIEHKIKCVRFPIMIATVMILVWMYGIIRGILLGNNTTNIIRNFAGMSVYILVIPLLNSNMSCQKYINLVKKISKYAVLISCITYILLTYFSFQTIYNIPVLNAFVGGGGIDGFVQYFCRELIHVSFAYSFFVLIVKKEGILKNIVMIILTMFSTIVVNDSGGDIFAMGILAIVILITQVRHLNKRTVVLVIIAIAVLGALYLKTGEGLLAKLFSSQDGGNIRRWEEIKYFMNNMSFLGYGLGATLGFAGSGSYNYGTEIIYLNIFHKFGIFAVFVLMCYVATCIKAVNFLINNPKRNPDKVIPLALMAYLIPSLANPMLFGVLAVVSHLLATIILTKYDGEREVEERLIDQNENLTYRH